MAYEINIDGFIGEAGFFGGDSFTLKNLNEQLASMPTDTTEINVLINSGGGYVTEGFAIYDRLASLNQTVNTTVLGLCGSIATVIAQAGKKGKRSMYQNSDYFIHNPSWTPQSPDPIEAADLQKIADDLKASEEKILNFYNSLTGTDIETLRAKMHDAKTISATEAKDLGFIDNIISTQIQAATIYKFAAHITKQKQPMANFEDKLKEMFNAFKNEITSIVKPTVKNDTVKTSEGVDIFYEGVLEVGTKVFTDEAMTAPAPDGVHTVEGKEYIVTGGAVTEVKDVVADSSELDAAKAKVAELEAQIASKETEVTAKVEAAKAELATEFENKFTNFKKQFFTGDKLNEEIVQMFKGEEPAKETLSPMEAYAKTLREKNQTK